MKEYDEVALSVDLPDEGLREGDTGVIVDVLANGEAFVIEFFTVDGETIGVEILKANEVRPVQVDEVRVPSMRKIALA